MFYKKKDIGIKAIQSSFIFEFQSIEILCREIEEKGNSVTNTSLSEFDFLGVTDLFMTGSFNISNYLGRTSFFDYKNIMDSQKLVLKEDVLKEKIKELKNESIGFINLGLVYFNNDIDGKKFNSTIIIYTILNSNSSLEDIYKFGNSVFFKNKIIEFSIEKLRVEDLTLVGISDFYLVNGEGFFSVEGDFEDIKAIEPELLSKKKFKKIIKQIEKDYHFVG